MRRPARNAGANQLSPGSVRGPQGVRGSYARLLRVALLSVALALAVSGWSVSAASAASPATPAGLTAQIVQASVYLRWQKNAEPGIAYYQMYKLHEGSWVPAGVASSAIYLLVNLTYGVTYTYRVTAVNTAGQQSSPSEPVSFTPRYTTPPAAPAGLAAVGEDERVALSWNGSSDPRLDHYAVYRKGPEGAWPATPTATVSATATHFTEAGLTDGTIYRYRVVAVDRAGVEVLESVPAEASAAPRDSTPPAAPEGLVAVGEDERVALSWSGSSDPRLDHYAVYRRGEGGEWPSTPTAVVGVSNPFAGSTYSESGESGLRDGTTYYYRVVAVDHAGNEVLESVPAEASAAPRDSTPPAAPAGLTAVGEDERVALSWGASSDLRLDHYAIYRKGAEDAWPAAPTATVSATATSFVESGLSDGTTYAYRVVAVDHAGNEVLESVPAEASAAPRDVTPPPAPEGLVAVGEEEGVALSWGGSSDPRLDHYTVYRRGEMGEWPSAPTATVSATATRFTEGGLMDGTTYRYRVVAVDRAGVETVESAPAEASAAPRDVTPPAMPEGLAAAGEDERVALSWNGSFDPRLDHYAVYRRGEGGEWPSTPTAVVSVSNPLTGSTYTEGGLEDGTTYYYRVVAVDRAGTEMVESPPAEASATPVDPLPAAPEGLTAKSGEESRIDLSWDANTEAGFSYFAVYRQNEDGSWPTTPVATTTSPEYGEAGLTDGTAYAYRVTAVDRNDGESVPSAAVRATPADTTPPATPEGLTAQSGQEERAYMSWKADTESDFSHYVIYRKNADGTWPEAPTATSTAPVYTDTELTDGTTYYYRVAAVDVYGNESAPSTVVSATPRDITPPSAPAGLAATGGNENVELSWASNPEPDLSHYEIYKQGPEGNWPATPIATTTATTYTDAEVLGGTEYTYRITAVDTWGNESSPSALASATPTETTPPATPGQPVLTPGEEQIGVAWSLDHEYDVSHYLLYRQEPDGNWPGSPIASTTHNWWVDKRLVNGTAYAYRVVAVDYAGLQSPPSSVTEGAPQTPSIANPGALFAATSPWNEPLSPEAPVAANSQVMMSGIEPSTGRPAPETQGGLLASIAKSGTAIDSYAGYSSPIYVVPANQPLVPVNVIEPAVVNHVALQTVLSKGVPIPPGAQSAAGTDGHMTIYQPATNSLWDLWRACSPEGPNNSMPWVAAQTCPSKPAPTWTVQYGGVMTNVAQSLGYFDANSDPGYSAFNWGATATSLPVAAGMVTMAELQAGEIKHALALDIPGYALPGAACAYNNWRLPNDMGVTPIAWPAQRGDGGYFGADCIPEGARLRIEPSFNLNSIQLPKVTRMFALAAQKYGMIVRDRDQGGVSFFTEDPTSLIQMGAKLNPYTGLPWSNSGSNPSPNSLLYGSPGWSLFKNFPWSHVQVMQPTICHAKMAPCPQEGD